MKRENKKKDESLKEVIIKWETVSSPIKLANAFTDHLIDKINNIAEALPYSSVVAEKNFLNGPYPDSHRTSVSK